MNRWNNIKKKNVKNVQIDTFLEDLFRLYDEYDLSISHEDLQGAFVFQRNNKANKAWMRHAIDGTDRTM